MEETTVSEEAVDYKVTRHPLKETFTKERMKRYLVAPKVLLIIGIVLSYLAYRILTPNDLRIAGFIVSDDMIGSWPIPLAIMLVTLQLSDWLKKDSRSSVVTRKSNRRIGCLRLVLPTFLVVDAVIICALLNTVGVDMPFLDPVSEKLLLTSDDALARLCDSNRQLCFEGYEPRVQPTNSTEVPPPSSSPVPVPTSTEVPIILSTPTFAPTPTSVICAVTPEVCD